jgi:hypothetical protein
MYSRLYQCWKAQFVLIINWLWEHFVSRFINSILDWRTFSLFLLSLPPRIGLLFLHQCSYVFSVVPFFWSESAKNFCTPKKYTRVLVFPTPLKSPLSVRSSFIEVWYFFSQLGYLSLMQIICQSIDLPRDINLRSGIPLDSLFSFKFFQYGRGTWGSDGLDIFFFWLSLKLVSNSRQRQEKTAVPQPQLLI